MFELRLLLAYSSDINSVQVGGYSVQDWACYDPLLSVSASDITDCHRHPEVKRKLYSSYAECEEGELAIPIPRQVSVKATGPSRGPHINGDGALLLLLDLGGCFANVTAQNHFSRHA